MHKAHGLHIMKMVLSKEIGITPVSNLKKEFISLKNEMGYEEAFTILYSKCCSSIRFKKNTGVIKEGFDCDLVIWKDDEIKHVITKKD